MKQWDVMNINPEALMLAIGIWLVFGGVLYALIDVEEIFSESALYWFWLSALCVMMVWN